MPQKFISVTSKEVTITHRPHYRYYGVVIFFEICTIFQGENQAFFRAETRPPEFAGFLENETRPPKLAAGGGLKGGLLIVHALQTAGGRYR